MKSCGISRSFMKRPVLVGWQKIVVYVYLTLKWPMFFFFFFFSLSLRKIKQLFFVKSFHKRLSSTDNLNVITTNIDTHLIYQSAKIMCKNSHMHGFHIYVPHHGGWGGHIVFSVDPVGVGIGIASCLYSISLMNGWILVNLHKFIIGWVKRAD